MEQLLFAPNVVCYVRLAMLIPFSLLHCRGDYEAAFIVYVTSTGMDLLDGWLARRLNQCTRFGEVFDIVVDWYVAQSFFCLKCDA